MRKPVISLNVYQEIPPISLADLGICQEVTTAESLCEQLLLLNGGDATSQAIRLDGAFARRLDMIRDGQSAKRVHAVTTAIARDNSLGTVLLSLFSQLRAGIAGSRH